MKNFLKYFIFPMLSLVVVLLASANIFTRAADVLLTDKYGANSGSSTAVIDYPTINKSISGTPIIDYSTTDRSIIGNANCPSAEYAYSCEPFGECSLTLVNGQNQYQKTRNCSSTVKPECMSTTGQGAIFTRPSLTVSCIPNCTDYFYSNWGSCQRNNIGVFVRNRQVSGSIPLGCSGTPTTTPALMEECSPVVCTEDDYTCSEYLPLVCPSTGKRSRNCILKETSQCTEDKSSKPQLDKACTPPVSCALNVNGAWSECNNGKQSRPKFIIENDCAIMSGQSSLEEQVCCDDNTFKSGLDWGINCGPGLEYRYKIYKGNNQACIERERALTMTQKRASGYMSEKCSSNIETEKQVSDNEITKKVDLPKMDEGVQDKTIKQETSSEQTVPTKTTVLKKIATSSSEQRLQPTGQNNLNITATKADDRNQKIPVKKEESIKPSQAVIKTADNDKSSQSNQTEVAVAPAIATADNSQKALVANDIDSNNLSMSAGNAQAKEIAAPIQASSNISADCGLAQITNPEDCEVYVRQNTVVDECLAKGINAIGGCRNYLISTYGRPAKCAKVSEATCLNLINNVILAGLSQEIISPSTKESLASIAGQSATIDSQKDKIILNNQAAISTNLLPLAPQESPAKVKLLSAPTNNSEAVAPVAIAFDNDGDGLPNDLENRLGTSPDNPDTDGDGYNDKEEVITGNNPLGAGKMDDEFKARLAPIDLAIIKDKPIEHPRYANVSSSLNLLISKVESVRTNETLKTGELRLNGKANPNETVSIFIYSAMPIIVTAKADANGNWVYNLDKTLADGNHEVYVAINDDSGKVVNRSAVMNFIIKEAQAVTIDDYIQVAEAPQPKDNSTNMIQRYVWGGVILVVVCIILFFIAIRPKKEQPSL